MRRLSYVWAAAFAGCLSAAAEVAAPVVPALMLVPLLTLLLAQLPLPARAERPRTQRPPRSELDRHLSRRASRGEAE
ncbi:MAG TPA: hypothetical protein VNQ77_18005 [Frankiaceae bacterium]|nr:hypothetical protein [Frankiaceae bacterium]